jgi:hypothetical protein
LVSSSDDLVVVVDEAGDDLIDGLLGLLEVEEALAGPDAHPQGGAVAEGKGVLGVRGHGATMVPSERVGSSGRLAAISSQSRG